MERPHSNFSNIYQISSMPHNKPSCHSELTINPASPCVIKMETRRIILLDTLWPLKYFPVKSKKLDNWIKLILPNWVR